MNINPYSPSQAPTSSPAVKPRDGDDMAINIAMLSVLYDPPVVNCEIKPYILLKTISSNRSKGIISNNTTRQRVITDRDVILYRWYRGQKRVCSSKKCKNGAKLQCLICIQQQLKSNSNYNNNALSIIDDNNIDLENYYSYSHSNSFFCSKECFTNSWSTHKLLHKNPNASPKNISAPFNLFPPPLSNIWTPISESKCYTPTTNDIGRNLALECAVLMHDNDTYGPPYRIETSAVLPAPELPPPRNLLRSNLNIIPEHINLAGSQFTVICYNCLAECYATHQLYPYCPLWALSYNYRKNNILREVLSYNADIMSLQEIQGDKFEDFYKPELSKNGYHGIFFPKTRDNPVFAGSGNTHPRAGDATSTTHTQVDGCAIFFSKARFNLVAHYNIEFDSLVRQAALATPGSNGVMNINGLNFINCNPLSNNPGAVRRLLKGNIGLVVILEEISPGPSMNYHRQKPRLGMRRKLCVANTHIFWEPEYPDVKLWQTMLFASEIEKILYTHNPNPSVMNALPLIICGDFNTEPPAGSSAVYQLLHNGKVPIDHPVFSQTGNPYDIFPLIGLPNNAISHNLPPMSSTYSSVCNGMEPKYTNFTGTFVGTLDYIFFSKPYLFPIGVLEMYPEEILTKDTALPSPQLSSDHVALVAVFDWLF